MCGVTVADVPLVIPLIVMIPVDESTDAVISPVFGETTTESGCTEDNINPPIVFTVVETVVDPEGTTLMLVVPGIICAGTIS
jgi:hypothetical protein